MGQRYRAIEPRHIEFIRRQQLFFAGTAAADGRVNVSPKGLDSLRVLGPNRIIWLNLTGSGNETAAHVLNQPRMTLMFCAFEGDPLILRTYGRATVHHDGDAEWPELIRQFPQSVGARQIFDLEIDLVQSSCGFGVPYMVFSEQRERLPKWSEQQSDAEIRAYRKRKNSRSLDGKPTDFAE